MEFRLPFFFLMIHLCWPRNHTYTSTAGTFAKSYPPKTFYKRVSFLVCGQTNPVKVVTRGKTEEAARSNERKEKQEHMRLQNDVLMYLADVFTCVPRQIYRVFRILGGCVKTVVQVDH